MEQRGIRTERGDINRAIMKANEEIEDINATLLKLEIELQQIKDEPLQAEIEKITIKVEENQRGISQNRQNPHHQKQKQHPPRNLNQKPSLHKN